MRRLYSFLRADRAEADLARELASHLALAEDEFRRRGMSREQARLAARRALGGVEQAKELHRHERSFLWLEDARRDVRHAVRSLARTPGFTAVSIVTLALGIGASTAIFSVAYGVSLRRLPYPEPDRLIRIYEANPANGQLRRDVSVGAFHDWREGASSIESAALYSKDYTRFLAGSDQQPISMMRVSPSFFDVLRVGPFLGPGFKPEREYRRFTADDEVMLSYGAWRRLFGGRPDIIGQRLEFPGAGDNDVYRIVGVMPERFAFAEPVGLWRPASIVEVPIRPTLRTLRADRAAFGALALVLAAVGIYGTLSYLVGTRTREIGIRLALGAPPSGIVSNILWRALVPAIAGGLIGLAIAAGLARIFRALLFDVEPLDIRSFAGGATLLFLVALAAALGPARRASHIDPARALRAE